MTSIQIHEFSTGIRPQINADGSWVSLGFTGQYMNTTINPIPPVVQRSIANKEFAVAEGAFSDQPAVIGRVVLDSENSGWSVVAVVSRGQDEKGRSASFYRYFFCDGQNNLSNILAWMEEYEQKNGHKPVFNPSETKVTGEANSTSVSTAAPQSNIPQELLQKNTSIPIIILPTERYTLQEINFYAFTKANNQPVAWAVNVEALEKPWSFIVIQASSDRAYQILHKAIVNTPNVQTPVVADEQALKSAIKNLMGSSTVKPEAVDAVIEALGNNQINTQYWHSLFDGQGARNAITQKIYSPQMLRLLTLRALIIPQTLPEYLNWLNIKDSSNKRDLNPNVTNSLEFQYNLISLFPDYSIIQSNLNYLFQQVELYNPPVNVLENIGDYCLHKLHSRKLALIYYQFAAYFAASTDKNNNVISDKLFQKAFSNSRGQENVFGRTIYSEQYRRQQGELIVPVPNVIVYVLLSFLLGGLGGFFIAGNMGERQETGNKIVKAPDGSTDTYQPNPIIDTTPSPNKKITLIPKGKKREDALNNFSKETIPAINTMINDFETQQQSLENPKTREEIFRALKETLESPTLDESVLDNQDLSSIPETTKNNWVNAIYSYQLRKNTGKPEKAEGYISRTGDVVKKYLKPDVESELKKASKPPAAP